MRSQRQKRFWRRFAAGLLVLALLYGLACFSLAKTYLSPRRSVLDLPAGMVAEKIDTRVGKVPIWITPRLAVGRGRPIVFVLAHGYGGCRGTWSDGMAELANRGYEAVAPAMPGHDESPDTTTGFGVKEAKVIVETVRWVRGQYPGKKPKIVLMGISMGGAAVWLASERDPSVDAVISDCAFARFDEAMTTWFDGKAPYASVYLRPVIWIASSMSGLDPASVNPVDAAKKWNGKPALVICGGNDVLIPKSHAERLSRAAGCPMWTVPGATHAHCYEEAKPEYLRRITAFADSLAR